MENSVKASVSGITTLIMFGILLILYKIWPDMMLFGIIPSDVFFLVIALMGLIITTRYVMLSDREHTTTT